MPEIKERFELPECSARTQIAHICVRKTLNKIGGKIVQ